MSCLLPRINSLSHGFVAVATSNFRDTFQFLFSLRLRKSHTSSGMKQAEGIAHTPNLERANEHTLTRTCAKMEVNAPWAHMCVLNISLLLGRACSELS